MSLDLERRSIYVPRAEGISREMVSDLYVVKLTAAQTGNSFAMVQAFVPPGGGPPPHIHYKSDEIFYLLDGDLEFLDGERSFTASAGDAIFLPRGTTHRFHNSSTTPARMLFMYTPGGAEGAFVEAGDVPTPGVAMQPWGPERITSELMSVMTRFDTFPPDVDTDAQ